VNFGRCGDVIPRRLMPDGDRSEDEK
jgi:hypothetical protein